MLLAEVAIPVPLGQAFSYSVPAELAAAVRPGCRVLCELGRRRLVGVVLSVVEREPKFDPARLKPVRAVLDAEPALEAELLALLVELSRYYFAPIGEVLRLALPAVERESAEALREQGLLEGSEVEVVGRLAQVAEAVEGALPEVEPRGQALEIWRTLREQGPLAVSELGRRWKSARAAVGKLEALGLVRVRKLASQRDPFFAAELQRDVPPELGDAQRRAVEVLLARLDAQAPGAFLLQGVTASGKTEVYLRAVERARELGRGAIVLVPEIALTPQLVTRFRARLGDAIAVLHSGLGERDRHAMWRSLRAGQMRVVVGARSALFAPVQRLGLICVDEEHDGSFKQEEGVRYNARDMALLRAHRARAVCVLGSATPSLESAALVRAGKLEHLVLPQRIGESRGLPRVELIDLRSQGAGPSGERLLTLPLHRALEGVLAARQQAILFLNRRGWAPSLVCDACGYVKQCPHCSIALTVHRGRGPRLICHYCDHSVAIDAACAACGSRALGEEGLGTERVEAALGALFPGARVARLDRDVAAGLASEEVLARMRRGEIDILVGTQMVTKGHDLPAVTLVGVLNADAALSMPDYRASERTFQLLVQVAGRAGRGDAPGRVLVQTRCADHPAIAFALRQDVNGFLAHELAERRLLAYPPYSRVALVRIEGADEAATLEASEVLARTATAAAGRSVLVLGPASAPIAKLRGRFRFRFMLRAAERADLRRVVAAVLRHPPERRFRVIVDVDPMTML